MVEEGVKLDLQGLSQVCTFIWSPSLVGCGLCTLGRSRERRQPSKRLVLPEGCYHHRPTRGPAPAGCALERQSCMAPFPIWDGWVLG